MSEARRRKVTLVQKSEDNVVFDKKAKNVILSPAKTPVFKQAGMYRVPDYPTFGGGGGGMEKKILGERKK